MSTEDIARRMQDWLVTAGLPFWAEAGVDRQYGGFIEELTFQGKDAAHEFKRVRVTGRQIYVYAHALMLGWTDGADLIARGCDYLATRAWRKNEGGFARRLTRDGAVLDPTPDLYDHAFCLFGFAWAYKATGDLIYRDWLTKTQDYIDAKFSDEEAGGYWHQSPPEGWRLQNPHMHMLEASLVAFDATHDDRYLAAVNELTGLFRRKFFQPDAGVLAEFFQNDWSPAPGEDGALTEPGHQYEWAWILNECDKRHNVKARAEAEALIAFGERYGLNPQTGAVYNRVASDGTIIDSNSRSWTNTERLKAAIAMADWGVDPTVMLQTTSDVIFDQSLSSAPGVTIPKGGYIDNFDAKGRAIANYMPTSILYHIMLAFAEVMRHAELESLAPDKV